MCRIGEQTVSVKQGLIILIPKPGNDKNFSDNLRAFKPFSTQTTKSLSVSCYIDLRQVWLKDLPEAKRQIYLQQYLIVFN